MSSGRASASDFSSALAFSSSWGMMRRSAKAAMPPNLLALYSVIPSRAAWPRSN